MSPPVTSTIAGAADQHAAQLDAIYDKVARRLIPFLVLLFLMAWLDRYNLGFAKLQMVKDLGFSEAVYGFGAGIVYLGYRLFEIPSNLFLERIGARRTFARITILWGITSVAMVLVNTAMVLSPAVPARFVRGRLASRCGAVSDVLVSGTASRADGRRISDSHPSVDDRRWSRLGW
jgi:sugar phosphate permease